MTKTDPLTIHEWDELISLRNHLGLLEREAELSLPVRKQLVVCRIIVERINHAHDATQNCYENAGPGDEWPEIGSECWEAIK